MSNNLKRMLFLLMLPVFFSANVNAQLSSKDNKDEIIQFTFHPASDALYMQRNENEFKRLYSFVDQHLIAINSGQIPIYVDGYCASAGNKKENYRLAFIRSNRVKSELIVNKGLLEKHFVTTNHTTARNGVKDVVIVKFKFPEIPEQKVNEPETMSPTDREEKPVVKEPEPLVESPSNEATHELVSTNPTRRILDLRTNLLYDAFLTPTLGIEWHVSNSIGIKLDASYAFWGNEHGRVHKLWLISPEVRWYMGNTRQFYLGIGGNAGEVNIYKGMVGNIISGKTGYQGKLYGGGITGGYLLKLSPRFSLDFNIGLGYTRIEYDAFSISNEVRVFKEKNKTKNIWGPTQAGISLIWHFFEH